MICHYILATVQLYEKHWPKLKAQILLKIHGNISSFYVLGPGKEQGSRIWLKASSGLYEVVVIVDGMIYVQHYVGLLSSILKI